MASVESKSARSERLLILLLCSAALRVFRTALYSPKFPRKSYDRHRFSGIFQPIESRPVRSGPRTVIYQNDLNGLAAKIAWTRSTTRNYKHGLAEKLAHWECFR